MSAEQLIDQILSLTADIEERQECLDELHAQRRGLITQALKAGAGAQPLASALGISRQQVYKLAAKDQR